MSVSRGRSIERVDARWKWRIPYAKPNYIIALVVHLSWKSSILINVDSVHKMKLYDVPFVKMYRDQFGSRFGGGRRPVCVLASRPLGPRVHWPHSVSQRRK